MTDNGKDNNDCHTWSAAKKENWCKDGQGFLIPLDMEIDCDNDIDEAAHFPLLRRNARMAVQFADWILPLLIGITSGLSKK